MDEMHRYRFGPDDRDFDWLDDVEGLDDLDEEALFEEDDFEEDSELGEVLRGLLSEEYEDASPEELDEALSNMFDSMSLAESFNFSNALSRIGAGAAQIGAGASKAISDPTIGQIVRSAAPIVGGAVGGPLGAAAASSLLSQVPLGTAAAKALPGVGAVTPGAAAAPAVAAGSRAAAQGLVLTQQPDVLRNMAQLALGQVAKRSPDAGAIMATLSQLFGEAAEDADALFSTDEAASAPIGASGGGDPWAPADRAETVYAELLSSANEELNEALGWR